MNSFHVILIHRGRVLLRMMLGWRQLVPLVLGLCACAAVAAVAGYSFGRRDISPVLSKRLYALQKQVAKTAQALHQAETRDHAKDTAIAARIVQLNAEVDRLDAMGHGIVGLAGLRRAAFNFKRLPGEGGPKPAREVPWTGPKLSVAIKTLSSRVWQLSDELLALRGYLLNTKLASQVVPHGRPLGHGWISSPWGWRPDPFDPLHGKWEFHPGIDFADREGSTIHAIAAGVVTWAGPRYGYGELVIVNDGGGYTTYYAHAEKVLVSVGEIVRRGEPIALVGDTGRSTGPHLFLEVRYKGRPINPAKYVADQSGVSRLSG